MFLDVTFVRKGHYRVDSTGNPALISKSLIDELMRMIYDEEVVGITDRNKPLTAEEVPAVRKVAESRRYMLRGAIKWLSHERTVNRRYTATDRFYLMRWP